MEKPCQVLVGPNLIGRKLNSRVELIIDCVFIITGHRCLGWKVRYWCPPSDNPRGLHIWESLYSLHFVDCSSEARRKRLLVSSLTSSGTKEGL